MPEKKLDGFIAERLLLDWDSENINLVLDNDTPKYTPLDLRYFFLSIAYIQREMSISFLFLLSSIYTN